jgi:putative FmdB family regulatory protein
MVIPRKIKNTACRHYITTQASVSIPPVFSVGCASRATARQGCQAETQIETQTESGFGPFLVGKYREDREYPGVTMPIYEYHCHTCGKDFSHQAKIADAPPVRGQDCVSNRCVLEKQLSLIAAPCKHHRKPAEGPSLASSNEEVANTPVPGGCSGMCSH